MKKTRKFRILSILLAILMVMNTLSGITLHTHAATTSAYDGKPVTPKKIAADNYVAFGLTPENWSGYNGYYGIRTAAELYGFADLVNGGSTGSNAVLLQDIVVNETVSPEGAAYSWPFIGISSNPYNGTFDGNGHTISGLYQNQEVATGLFGVIGSTKPNVPSSAVIKNITLKNSYFKANTSVTGIVSRTYGYGSRIQNCKVAEDVKLVVEDLSGWFFTGAILGMFDSLSSDLLSKYKVSCYVTDCVSFAKIQVFGTDFTSVNDANRECIGNIVGCYHQAGNAFKFVEVSGCYYLSGTLTDENGDVLDYGTGGYSGYSKNVGCTTLSSTNDSHTCVSVEHKEVKATCSFIGLSAYSECLICGQITSGTRSESAVNDTHFYEGANCVTNGTCVMCGTVAEKDATLHVSEEYTYVIDSADSTKHEVSHKCCGAYIKTELHGKDYTYVKNDQNELLHDVVCIICSGVETTEEHQFVNGTCSLCKTRCTHSQMSEGACVHCGAEGMYYVYREWDGTKVIEEIRTTPGMPAKITNRSSTLSDGWYMVQGTVEVQKLVINGTVNLLLCDGAYLKMDTAGVTREGIIVNQGNTLNIYVQPDVGGTPGKISIASSMRGNAGIGGSNGNSSGTINIHGGTINAQGAFAGAGIGGGIRGSNGTVIIHGGTINASGGAESAGIGGGAAGSGGTVIITGGSVKAVGGRDVMSIGGGSNGSSGTLTDAGGNKLSLVKLRIDNTAEEVKVTQIKGLENYGLTNVTTMDSGTLYLYLPEGAAASSITAGGVEYICNRSNTFYAEHIWNEADCLMGEHCSECGYVKGVELGHDYVDGMCIRCGIGEEDGIFYIGTAKQLRMFAEYVNAGNKTANAKLMADIDLENEDWTMICETGLYYNGYGEDLGYAGTFDGNGHVIKNVKVKSSTIMDASCGLFGTVSGTVKNLGIEGFTFVDGGKDIRTGAIVGQLITANGRVENCYTKNATIKPGEHVTGGIAGCVYDGTIENCYVVESDINGTANRYGYIVGDSRGDGGASDRPGTVNNCYTDHATIRSNNVGNITNCATKNAAAFASGEVTYLLNGSKSDGDLVWYQTLTEQAYPQFKGVVVYYDETNGYTNHIHEWTYEKDGDNKIIATCNVDDCYNPDGGSVTIIAPENPVYDQAAKAAAYESTGNFEGETYTIIYKDAEGRELQDAPANAGTYTAELTAHDCTAELEFTIEKAEVTIENVHLYDSKPYDGTAVFTELDEVNIAGVLEGDEVAVASIEGTVASADVGLYHELTVTAIKLTGKDADNYQIKLPAVANVVDHIGNDGALGISPLYLTVIAKDQTVSLNGELDQTQWELTDGSLIEGQKLEVTLLADTSEQTDFGVIELEVKILDAEGNDVTDNYIIHQIDGALTVACADHTEFTNGFCNNCDGYQEPALDDNGTEDSWDDQYLIENAGQLFWIANYIHNVTNEVDVKVLNDITIPEGKEWTPIMNFYGTFDGNYHTISGMHVQSEGNQVGMFGGGGYFYGTVKNLHLSDSYFEGNYYVGGIAGYFGGTMENCYVDDTVIVKGQNFSAALVGDNYGTILNSYAYAEKLVGYNSGTTENSYYLAAEDDGNGGKTAAQFKSGEVAYLLQAGQQGETEWDDELQDYVEVAPAPQVWGQNIDLPSKDADEYPTFDGAKVYQMTESEVFYTNLLPGQEEEKESVTEVFVDVAEGAWYVDSVQYVYDEGIIIGDGNIFAPDNGTTRAMVAVILYRLAGSPDVTEADYEEYNKFGDLPKEKAWYSDAVAWALKEKVSTGDDYAMLYNPELPVTREQLALFLWRYAKYNEEDVTVTATKEELFGETYVNSWAEEGFAWAVDRGIIRGAEETDSEGNLYYVLNPQGGATRAQLARMLHRYLGESNG